MSNTTNARTKCISGAIYVAAEYSNNNKTDWHLPSRDELDQLKSKKTAVGGFADDVYWSSTEGGGLGAWNQNFGNTNAGFNYKIDTSRVRPVRAF